MIYIHEKNSNLAFVYCRHLAAKELLLRDGLAIGACALVRHIGVEEAVMQEEHWRGITEG